MSVTYSLGMWVSARNVVGETLHELGKKHDNLWVLTPDVGGALKTFKRDYSDRFVDVGIAEQNVNGIAAGLALEGNIPFIMGMLPFLSLRACEQVRTAICYQNLPVRIVGIGGGLVSNTGSTHYSIEDISIMKSMVNMTVIATSDPNMVRDILDLSITYPGPMFIRLGPGKNDRVIYEAGTMKYLIGKGLTIRDGKDVTIFTYGDMVGQALEAAKVLEEEKIDVRIIDMFTIKPLDKEIIQKAVEETGRIVVLEDHLMMGGLASSIADVFADTGVYPTSFRRLGIPQIYAGFGNAPELRAKYGYDTIATVSVIKGMLSGRLFEEKHQRQ